MTGRERTQAILNRKPADRTGFWLGNPSDGAKFAYYKHLGIPCAAADTWASAEGHYTTYSGTEDIEMGKLLSSDLMWFAPDLENGNYKHPEGKPIFDTSGGLGGTSGVFTETEDVAEVDNYEWPNPDYMDFTHTEMLIERASAENMAIFCSSWGHFFHVACDLFGMEDYFMKMLTDPQVVEAVTERIVDFQFECNKRMYEAFGDKIDCVFFGNDIGTQVGTLVGMDQFKQFLYPYMKKLTEQAKKYNKKVALHSCGAIAPLIPLMIDAGIDVLHPLQALATGMEPEVLVREYGKDLIFMGGVDTQNLLPFGTPQQVRAETHRLRDIFGPGFIASPSHEAILPNVPIENMLAMRDAAID